MIINTIKSIPVPIRVICIGDDNQPATTQEIEDVHEYVKNNNSFPINYHLPISEYFVDRNPKPGFVLVKVGNTNKPATLSDIQSLEQELSNVVNDPKLIIVTHHTFDMEWIHTSIANCPAFIVGHGN